MLVYEETANDLHLELSRIKKNRHSFMCARWSHVKFCAVKMRTAKLRNHLKEKAD